MRPQRAWSHADGGRGQGKSERRIAGPPLQERAQRATAASSMAARARGTIAAGPRASG